MKLLFTTEWLRRHLSAEDDSDVAAANPNFFEENNMSWSISAVGKAAAVAAKFAEDANRIKCSDPEETIKRLVSETVAKACEAMPANVAVQIEASGSQYTTPDGGAVNNLSVKIAPLYGFVE